MKSKFQRVFLFATLCGLAVIIASGCATTRTDLVADGAVSLELAPTEKIYVARAHAYRQDSELIVSGKVRRYRSEGIGGGDVKVVVTSPDGTVISESIAPYFPRIIPREGARESTFIARIPDVPPRGSVISVRYYNP